MLPVLRKIKSASEGEVDQAFWRGMFKHHDLKQKGCGDPKTLADRWIVKFCPYDSFGERNGMEDLYNGASSRVGTCSIRGRRWTDLQLDPFDAEERCSRRIHRPPIVPPELHPCHTTGKEEERKKRVSILC